MPKEQYMHIEYKGLTGVVTVHFRGQKTILPAKYENRELGMKAGKEYCVKMGWDQKA